MPQERDLEKQLKLVAKTGKYVVGRREVMGGIKGSKLLVWSASAGLPQTILDDSKNLQIPAVRFNGNPVELGRACGIPFRVSVIAVKSAGDADLKAYSSSADYFVSGVPTILPSIPSSSEPPETEMKEAETPKKRKKAEGKVKSETEPKLEKKKKTASLKSEEKKAVSEDDGREKPTKKKAKAESSEEKKEKPTKQVAKKETSKKNS